MDESTPDPEETPLKEGEKRILLPQPKGFRRGNLVFKNGVGLAVDEEPEVLIEKIKAFPKEEKFLLVTDTAYGETVALTHTALDDGLMWVGVAWVENTRPKGKEIIVPPLGTIPLNRHDRRKIERDGHL